MQITCALAGGLLDLRLIVSALDHRGTVVRVVIVLIV